MTEEDLKDIEHNLDLQEAGFTGRKDPWADDIRRLIAEVRRLREYERMYKDLSK